MKATDPIALDASDDRVEPSADDVRAAADVLARATARNRQRGNVGLAPIHPAELEVLQRFLSDGPRPSLELVHAAVERLGGASGETVDIPAEPRVLVEEARPDDQADSDEIENGKWSRTHSSELAALRALGRAWGVGFVANAPATWGERVRIEAAAATTPPSHAALEWVGRDPMIQTQHPFMLFQCAPAEMPLVVSQALAILKRTDGDVCNAALRLGRGIRSWDPDLESEDAEVPHTFSGTLPRFLSQRLDLVDWIREAAGQIDEQIDAQETQLRETDEQLRSLRQLSGGSVIDDIIERLKWKRELLTDLKEARDQNRLVEFVAALLGPNNGEAPSKHRRRIDAARERGENALLAINNGQQLPQHLQRSVDRARTKYWKPIAEELRAADEKHWNGNTLEKLILADVWFVDLIPWTRSRYSRIDPQTLPKEHRHSASKGLQQLLRKLW